MPSSRGRPAGRRRHVTAVISLHRLEKLDVAGWTDIGSKRSLGEIKKTVLLRLRREQPHYLPLYCIPSWNQTTCPGYPLHMTRRSGTFWPPSLFSPGIAWSNATNGFPVAPTPPIHNPFLDARFNPIIVILVGYLKALMPGVLYNAVKSAHDQIPEFMDTLNITDALSFVVFANGLLRWTPTGSFHGRDVYHILTMFYFIFDQPGLAELQDEIHPSQAGQQLTWLSSWLVAYAQLIGLWMDNPLSSNSETVQTFRETPLYNVSEAIEPEGGWKTFNEYFSRKLKKGVRPIDSPDDDLVIVYPADSTFDAFIADASIVGVENNGTVFIKKLPWTIASLLQGSDHAADFNGGVWMHAFLNTHNYHRQHAPVRGGVLETRNIQALAYLEVVLDNSTAARSGDMPGPDAPDKPGYQFLQTRGLVVIENPTLGKVAMLPIGMAQVSSVVLHVKEGDWVEKRDEISNFAFGGSDIICVFQNNANLTFEDSVPSPDDSYSRYGTRLAKAKRRA